MKVAERKKFEIIPSKIDANEILRLVQSAKGGFSIYFSILKLITNCDDKEISEWLSISEKTFRSYKLSSGKAKPILGERAVMLISLFKHGIEIFGSEQSFKKWLDTKNVFFDQEKPSSFMDTASGIKFIDDRLTGMEYGDNV